MLLFFNPFDDRRGRHCQKPSKTLERSERKSITLRGKVPSSDAAGAGAERTELPSSSTAAAAPRYPRPPPPPPPPLADRSRRGARQPPSDAAPHWSPRQAPGESPFSEGACLPPARELLRAGGCSWRSAKRRRCAVSSCRLMCQKDSLAKSGFPGELTHRGSSPVIFVIKCLCIIHRICSSGTASLPIM